MEVRNVLKSRKSVIKKSNEKRCQRKPVMNKRLEVLSKMKMVLFVASNFFRILL